MKHIQDYMSNIEKAIIMLNKTKTKPTKGGLLSPNGDRSEKPAKTNDMMVVANFVAGIRAAKEEMKNGK